MTETQQDEDATKLYRYVASGQLWELRNSSARPTFLNLSSDEPDATCRHWYLQAGTEALHIEVSHSFEADPAKTRFKLVDSEGARVWGLVFSSTAAFEAFHAQWNQCLYENTYQCAFRSESTDKGPFSFGVQAADTASAAQAQAVSEQQRPSLAALASMPFSTAAQRDTPVLGLCLGSNASYLLRDGQLDVMHNAADGLQDTSLSFRIPHASRRAANAARCSAEWTPLGGRSKMLLLAQEHGMALLQPGMPRHLSYIDVHTGRPVVDYTFKVNGMELEVQDLAGEAAVMARSHTFLGLGCSRLSRWDLRDPDLATGQAPVVAYADGKDYGRSAQLSCMATAGNGCLVVGSADGRLRLFDAYNLARASTTIPGLGCAITHVDVTWDAQHILATTDHFILLLQASTGASACSAWQAGSQWGQFTPRLLRLKPEDVSKMHGGALHRARFARCCGADQPQEWITASVGNYTLLFSFRELQGSRSGLTSIGNLPVCTDYVLMHKPSHVLDSFVTASTSKHSPQTPTVVAVTEEKIWVTGRDSKGRGGSASRAASLSLSVNAWNPTNAAG